MTADLQEQIARIIDPDAWEPFNVDPIFMLAEDRRRSLVKAKAILFLISNTEASTHREGQ
jgi:hypothetical protein